MQFEWDERKNRSNVEKHGLSFETAIRIFDGVVLSSIDARYDYGELREISIGTIAALVAIVVAHTDRDGVTRVISARPAKKMERTLYEKALHQRIKSR